jgi:hypothetical protein
MGQYSPGAHTPRQQTQGRFTNAELSPVLIVPSKILLLDKHDSNRRLSFGLDAQPTNAVSGRPAADF